MKSTNFIKQSLALIPALLLALFCTFLCVNHLEAANTYAATLVRSSSQYFSAADSPSLSITGDMTIEAWVKLASLPSSGAGAYFIISKDDAPNTRSFNFY